MAVSGWIWKPITTPAPAQWFRRGYLWLWPSLPPSLLPQIEKSRISVRISCLAEDLTARDWPRPPSLPPLDRHFDEARALKEYEERRRKIEEKVRLLEERV